MEHRIAMWLGAQAARLERAGLRRQRIVRLLQWHLFDQCGEQHPKYGWRCGDWEYAREHRIYPRHHGRTHHGVGRLNSCNVSTTWNT